VPGGREPSRGRWIHAILALENAAAVFLLPMVASDLRNPFSKGKYQMVNSASILIMTLVALRVA
jgi:hypothetical protein